MMRFSLGYIWAILVVWLVLSAVNWQKSDSNGDPSCPTCAEAKPLVTKYKYVTQSGSSKNDHPVAILLAFNSNAKAKKARLNTIPISPDLLSDLDDSDETIEIPIRSHGGRVSGHSSKTLRKLLRPLIENGDLESNSAEEEVLDEWQCKRDELINLLRVVLRKKNQLLANKHGIIDSVLSDEDKLVVVTPIKKPAVPVVVSNPVSVAVPAPVPAAVPAPVPVAVSVHSPVPVPAPVPVAVPAPAPVAVSVHAPVAVPAHVPVAVPAPAAPIVEPVPVAIPVAPPVVQPVPIPVPVLAPESQEASKEECTKSFMSELKELLGHFPQAIRDKVSSGVKKMMEKITHTKLSDMKSAIRGVVLDLIKGIVTPSASNEQDDDSENSKEDEKASVIGEIAGEVGGGIIEKVVEKVINKDDHSDSDEKPEKHSLINKENIKDLIVNFNPKVLKEKILQLIKKIIEQLSQKGFEALHDLVEKLLKEFIKDLARKKEQLEKLKPIIKKIGEKIIRGIKNIVKIAVEIEGDKLKENVKNIIGKIIDDILECLYPDDHSGSDESQEHPSKTSKHLITKALLAVVDNVLDELIEKKSSSEETSKSEEDEKPIFSSIKDILDRLKQIPEIIQEKLLEGVKRIIGEIGKDQGPNLEELVGEIVEDILLGILSPDKPLPEPIRKLLQPIVEKISDFLLDAVKGIINEVANKNFEGIEDAVSGIVHGLIQDVIDFITGKGDASDESRPHHSLGPIENMIPEEVRPIVVKVVDKLLDKFLHKDSEESSKSEEECDESDEHKPSLTDILKVGELILHGLKSILEKVGTEELKDLDAIATKILSTIPDEKIKHLVEPILEKVHEKFVDCLKNLFKLVLEEGLEGLGEKLKDLVCNLLKDLLGPLITSDCKGKAGKSPAEEIIEKLLPIIGDIVELLSKGLKDKVDSIKELLHIGPKDDEDNNESASHISEIIESKPSSEETEEDPIPEGLVPDALLPVIGKIVDVLDVGGEKNNKDLIKQVTDELLTKLLSLAPEKPQDESHSEGDDHYDSEEDHLDAIPTDHSHSTGISISKVDDLPDVVVLPTETDGTYRVSLNIDKLVDKEYKKFKNLRCQCMEGPIADERCPFHQLSKDEIKENIKAKFFRNVIKGVPIAEKGLALGGKIVSKVVEDAVDKAQESISHEHDEDHDDDHHNEDDHSDESPESEEHSHEESGKKLITKVVGKVAGKVGKKAIKSIVEKILTKLGKHNEEHKKHIKEIIKKMLTKLAEHKSDEEDDEEKSKGDKIKEFLSTLLSELLDNDSKESRHKRQFDIDPVSLLQNDDCPTCLKAMKRNTPEIDMESQPKIVCHNQVEAEDMEEHTRAKRENNEDKNLRMERAISTGCSCGSIVWKDNFGYNSTYFYIREQPRQERITRDDSNVSNDFLQENKLETPLSLTFGQDIL